MLSWCNKSILIDWKTVDTSGMTKSAVSISRKPDELKDLAPGTNPPFLLYNGILKTDFIKIEEFLEQTLAPPRLLFSLSFSEYGCWRCSGASLWRTTPTVFIFSSVSCRYPHLSPINKESFDVGADIFAKFSAFIKNSPNNSCELFWTTYP